jgi:hypothetical protein
MTGSAHDASAFEHTGAKQDPEWFFEGQEFAWVDSFCQFAHLLSVLFLIPDTCFKFIKESVTTCSQVLKTCFFTHVLNVFPRRSQNKLSNDMNALT